MIDSETQETLKRQAAALGITHVQDGMVVGLGTGSTAKWAVQLLGEKVAAGLQIRGVPTSETTARLAREAGIPLVDFETIWGIDVTLDGADEVDPDLNLIKGGGGALLREKIVAFASKLIILVDPSKLVPRLGEHFMLPVEVTSFGWQQTARHLAAVGGQPKLRTAGGGKPFITDNDNLILDCRFRGGIEDPTRLELDIDRIPGVVDSGLFVGLARRVIVGYPDGAREMRKDT